MWLCTPGGSIDYGSPILTDAFGLADMAFVTEPTGTFLYYTLNGSSAVRKLGVVAAPVPQTLQVQVTGVAGVPGSADSACESTARFEASGGVEVRRRVRPRVRHCSTPATASTPDGGQPGRPPRLQAEPSRAWINPTVAPPNCFADYDNSTTQHSFDAPIAAIAS